MSSPADITPYEQFGGAAFFAALVRAFYERVAVDPVLRPMYPPGDLAPAERRLRLFLEQYWAAPRRMTTSEGIPGSECATQASRSTPSHATAGSP